MSRTFLHRASCLPGLNRYRFADLEPDELQLVLSALDFNEQPGQAPRHGHKLGYGRPLGLGSVALRVNGIRVVEATPAPAGGRHLPTSFALVDWNGRDPSGAVRAVGQQWPRFLALHRLDGAPDDAGARSGAYPTGGTTRTVLGFHNEVRQKHLKERRG